MKNIIVGFLTILIILLMGYVASQGGAYNGGEANKVIRDFGDTMVAKPIKKQKNNQEIDTLNALKSKAGNSGAFEVSKQYKSKCSSCHGVNGSGFQNGKAMMGPKLIGQSADVLYKDLIDFKAGRKENVIMRGLLLSLDKTDLRELADEIGDFSTRLKNIQK